MEIPMDCRFAVAVQFVTSIVYVKDEIVINNILVCLCREISVYNKGLALAQSFSTQTLLIKGTIYVCLQVQNAASGPPSRFDSFQSWRQLQGRRSVLQRTRFLLRCPEGSHQLHHRGPGRSSLLLRLCMSSSGRLLSRPQGGMWR